MNERQALANRNLELLAHSKKFPFIRHCNLLRGYSGLIESAGNIYQYKLLNDLSNNIELEIDIPIICSKKTINLLLGYFITVNLIYNFQGVFSLDKQNRRVILRKVISYKYFVPSVQSLEWILEGLITMSDEYYGVINAIAQAEHVPNNERVSSRIYYDVFLKHSMIKATDTDELRLDKAFSQPDFDELVVKSDESQDAEEPPRDIDLDDTDWGTLFY